MFLWLHKSIIKNKRIIINVRNNLSKHLFIIHHLFESSIIINRLFSHQQSIYGKKNIWKKFQKTKVKINVFSVFLLKPNTILYYLTDLWCLWKLGNTWNLIYFSVPKHFFSYNFFLTNLLFTLIFVTRRIYYVNDHFSRNIVCEKIDQNV